MSYGLSNEQLIFSENRALNSFVPLKKLAPYREDEVPLLHFKFTAGFHRGEEAEEPDEAQADREDPEDQQAALQEGGRATVKPPGEGPEVQGLENRQQVQDSGQTAR